VRERSRQIADQAWTVTQIWECPAAETATHVSQLWLQRPTPAGAGSLSRRAQPIAVDVDIMDDRGGEGFDWIVAKYRTLTIDEYMDRNPNIGIFTGAQGLRGEKIRTCDLCEGNPVIQGEETNIGNGYSRTWIIEQGPQTKMVPMPRYTIRAVVDKWTTYIGQWLSAQAVGMVNADAMDKFGGARKYDLLFSRIAWEPTPYSNTYNKWIVEYDFVATGKQRPWNHRGEFDGLLITRPFERRVYAEEVLDMRGTPTGRIRDVWELVPMDKREYHDMYASKSFYPIYHLINSSNWDVR